MNREDAHIGRKAPRIPGLGSDNPPELKLDSRNRSLNVYRRRPHCSKKPRPIVPIKWRFCFL